MDTQRTIVLIVLGLMVTGIAAAAFMIALSEPGAFIMEQKMLRVIRNRLER